MLSLVIRELEINKDGDLEFTRYRYKSYGIGWMDNFICQQDSTRLHNRVCAVPLRFNNDGKWEVDTEKTNNKNAWIVAPVGGRVQTYNIGDKWDITPISDKHKVYKESSELQREILLGDTIRRVLSYIDLNC